MLKQVEVDKEVRGREGMGENVMVYWNKKTMSTKLAEGYEYFNPLSEKLANSSATSPTPAKMFIAKYFKRVMRYSV